MALDEPETNDSTFEDNGYTFIIDNELLEQVKNVTIDFTVMGFTVESSSPVAGGGGGGGCGSCGGGCGS